MTEIRLPAELDAALRREAARRGISPEAHARQLLEAGMRHEMPAAPTHWPSRPEWESLVAGAHCAVCKLLDGPEALHIADLRVSQLRLNPNQRLPGTAVLVSRQHVVEAHDLTPSDRGAFFEDVCDASRAILRAMKGDKINLEMLGNVAPHLHCHIKARFLGDPAPGAPFHPDQDMLVVEESVYRQRAQAIRSALRTSP